MGISERQAYLKAMRARYWRAHPAQWRDGYDPGYYPLKAVLGTQKHSLFLHYFNEFADVHWVLFCVHWIVLKPGNA